MGDGDWLNEQAGLSLERVITRLHTDVWRSPRNARVDWDRFEQRLLREWPTIFAAIYWLYGSRYDCSYFLEQAVLVAAHGWLERSPACHARDAHAEADPLRVAGQRDVGLSAPLERIIPNFAQLGQRIAYFRELGITYLHVEQRGVPLSPLQISQLCAAAEALASAGITLGIDLKIHSTPIDHPWAEQAKNGDRRYQQYYLHFSSAQAPEPYAAALQREAAKLIWSPLIQRWMWTNAAEQRWGLDYHNPAAFCAMLGEAMAMANNGVAVLHLVGAHGAWRDSQRHPPAEANRQLVAAFQALLRVAAPSVQVSATAAESAPLARLNTTPAVSSLLWEALATKDVRLLRQKLARQAILPNGSNYARALRRNVPLRWEFSDDEAQHVGLDPHGHRQFLGEFYTGKYPQSFSWGFAAPDSRADAPAVVGTVATLAGLAQAMAGQNPILIDLAVRRILLLHGVLLGLNGMPLICAGDEVAITDEIAPIPAAVGRLYGPTVWNGEQNRYNMASPAGYIFNEIQRLISQRTSQPALWGQQLQVIETFNRHVLGFYRNYAEQQVVVIANFSEYQHTLEPRVFDDCPWAIFTDLNTGFTQSTADPLQLGPYQFVWCIGG